MTYEEKVKANKCLTCQHKPTINYQCQRNDEPKGVNCWKHGYVSYAPGNAQQQVQDDSAEPHRLT